jgi:hypothetical protein
MNENRESNFWKRFNLIKRAHQYYIAFLLSVPSFLSIIYHSYIEPSFLVKIFPTLTRFVLVFAILYIPVLNMLGTYHFERKENRPKYEEAKLDMRANPWNQSIAQALMYLADGENEEAKRVLEEWV